MPFLVRRLYVIGLLLLLLPAAPIVAQTAPSSLDQPTLTQAHSPFASALALYEDSLYVQAFDAFDAYSDAFPQSALLPEALFYQAESALILGRKTYAQRLFQELQNRFPLHPLARSAFLHLAKRYYEAERYAESIEQLTRVLDAAPPPERMAEAYYWLGRAHAALDRNEEAVTYFFRAADYGTSVASPALYAAARGQVVLGRLQGAAETLERLRRSHPNSTYAESIDLGLADLYYQLGNYRQVITEIEQQPNATVEARFLLAQSYYQLGQYDEAIDHFEQLLNEAGASAFHQRATYGLAWSHYLQGGHSEAADYFAEAETGGNDSLTALAGYYQAVNVRLVGEDERAAALFATFVDDHEGHALAPRALYERGMILSEQEAWNEAETVFARLLSAYPAAEVRGGALRMRSEALVELGELETAAEVLDEALAASGATSAEQAELEYRQAWLLAQRGEHGAALDAFAAFLERYPNARESARALFWAGESAFQLERYEPAGVYFSRYLATYPNGPQADAARYALAWTRFEQGRYQEAARQFERFLAAYEAEGVSIPYRSDALLRLADSYFALKQYDAAVTAYNRVRGDGQDYALYQRAQAAANTGELGQAAEFFQQLINAYPQSRWAPPAQYRLGYVRLQQQLYEDAIAAYRTLVQRYPNIALAAQAQYGIGDAYFNAGRMEEAIEAYKEVLSRYPESAYAADAASSIQYAVMALGEGERTDAIIDEFAQASPNNPVVAELRFRQAEVKYDSGLIDEALAAFQQFIRISENTDLLPEAYFYLGTIYADRGQVTEAENYLQQLIARFEESPRRAEAAQRLGRSYLEHQQYGDALVAYRQLETLAEENIELQAAARYGQSRALLATARPDEAQRLLEEFLAAHPEATESSRIRLGLARIYESQGRTEEAGNLYREIIRQDRDDAGAEALFLLGSMQLEEGQTREAIETFSRMPTLYPGASGLLARSLLAQAEAFHTLGETANAQRLYDQVINQFSGTPFAVEAKREREALLGSE